VLLNDEIDVCDLDDVTDFFFDNCDLLNASNEVCCFVTKVVVRSAGVRYSSHYSSQMQISTNENGICPVFGTEK